MIKIWNCIYYFGIRKAVQKHLGSAIIRVRQTCVPEITFVFFLRKKNTQSDNAGN